jgi:pre-60S factor REI1
MQHLPHLVRQWASAERAHEKPLAVCVSVTVVGLANMTNSVYNLKRRIASLPPISQAIFDSQVQPQCEPSANTSKAAIVEEDEEDELASPHQCLFCHQRFDDDTDDFENTLEHMATTHGLFLPDSDRISDLGSFLGYLATEVRAWHECLYCGTTRTSTSAIQSHMRDSSHCKLNFDREPELLEFWEEKSDGVGSSLRPVGPDMSCGNVKPTTSRLSHQRRAKAARARGTRMLLQANAEPTTSPRGYQEQSCGQLSRRDEMGIQNIGPQQRHALMLAVKRSQKDEETASRASEWSYARKANKQKHDQAHGPLSWAKGGAHNLLPR